MSLGDDGYGDGYGGQDPNRTGGMGDTPLTRTRLPEGEDDLYGTPRRPTRPKPSRNLITVVSVVVLLLAAIAFANRGGDNGGDDDSGTSSADHDPDARPHSTAPTGERPVDGKNTTTGIASGFAKTEQGAQSAAANFTVALGSDGMFDTDRRHDIISAVWAPEGAKARQNELDKAFASTELLAGAGLDADGKAPRGATFVSRVTPVGTKVERYQGGTARVAVWNSVLFGLAGENSKNPVSEGWYTDTFDMKWVNGDWKVTKQTQKAGPAPVGRDQTASSAKEMADAVQGFGGFTYAR
ncbi:hypothetical protein ACZ90_49480 [Streptomyces albus subsp. albus]|nr:hypothetical protein ACZ90_49480 [Streptomyces albus subsp. albus]